MVPDTKGVGLRMTRAEGKGGGGSKGGGGGGWFIRVKWPVSH